MRPVALSPKNWIHVNSRQAGPKLAAILSVVETCRRMKIPLRSGATIFPRSSPATRSATGMNSGFPDPPRPTLVRFLSPRATPGPDADNVYDKRRVRIWRVSIGHNAQP